MQNLSATDFYKPTHFNPETKTQLWMSILADSHDSTCNCDTPFAHLLANIFPPGHKDRDLTINQILQRDYKEACRGGGRGVEGHGLADTKERPEETNSPEEKDSIDGDEITNLLDAIKEEGDAKER
nr:ORF1 [Torque teno midi virus]